MTDDMNPMGEPFIPRAPEWLLKANAGIKTTSELPTVIPPLPEGDTKDLKVWKEYWEKRDERVREREREHWQTERTKLIATIDEKIAEARKKAREDVLDALSEWFKTHNCWKSEHGNYWTPVPFPAAELMIFVESLRAKKE